MLCKVASNYQGMNLFQTCNTDSGVGINIYQVHSSGV